MKKKLSRRDFIRGGLLLGGASAAALTRFLTDSEMIGLSNGLEQMFLPSVLRYEPTLDPGPQPPPGSGGVVHVYAADAHNWNYSNKEYWNFVNQAAVDRMVDMGIKALTGQTDLSAAWKSLLPNYKAGEEVAIKVSFNNGDKTGEHWYGIDAVAEPVNAIIRGLRAAGVPPSAIVIFDSKRPIRPVFIQKINAQHNGVRFEDKNSDPFGSGSGSITFHPPSHTPITMKISKVVARAKYLINVPVLKRHGSAGISMGMKNHYGTIEDPDAIHPWTSIDIKNNPTVTTYSPIKEINQHEYIAGKTILVVGDGLFAALHNTGDRSFPVPWVTFNNQSPKSLFFSTDPVAIDCVMGDLLSAERIERGHGETPPVSFAHLQLAEQAGLGIFERGDPWTNSYKRINYRKVTV